MTETLKGEEPAQHRALEPRAIPGLTSRRRAAKLFVTGHKDNAAANGMFRVTIFTLKRGLVCNAGRAVKSAFACSRERGQAAGKP
jgi:hypothetical protein